MPWESGHSRFLLSYLVVSHRGTGLELVAQSYLEKRKTPSSGSSTFYHSSPTQCLMPVSTEAVKNEQIYLLDNFTMSKQSPVGKTNRYCILIAVYF